MKKTEEDLKTGNLSLPIVNVEPRISFKNQNEEGWFSSAIKEHEISCAQSYVLVHKQECIFENHFHIEKCSDIYEFINIIRFIKKRNEKYNWVALNVDMM